MTEPTTSVIEQVIEIPLEHLHPDEDNPRRKTRGGDGWKEFVQSIDEVGVLEPLIVRRNPNNAGGYVIVAGHRRRDASEDAGKTTAPCIVRDMTALDVIVAQVVENMQRADLDPIEEATAFFKANEQGMAPKDLAAKIGRPVKFVTDRIKLLDLPVRICAGIKKGDVSIGDALEIHKHLGKFPDDVLIDAAFRGRDIDWTLKAAARAEHQKAKAVVAQEQARKSGAREITRSKTERGLPEGTRKLENYELTPAACKGQSWLCFYMEPSAWGNEPDMPVFVTDDPKATRAFKKEKDPEFGKLTDEQIQNRAASKAMRESDAARMEALQASVNSSVSHTVLVGSLAAAVAESLHYDEAHDTATIAGIVPPEGESWTKHAHQWHQACVSLARENPSKFAKAFRLMVREHAFRKDAADNDVREQLQETLADRYDVKSDARAKQARRC